jgi:hypothetical protein
MRVRKMMKVGFKETSCNKRCLKKLKSDARRHQILSLISPTYYLDNRHYQTFTWKKCSWTSKIHRYRLEEASPTDDVSELDEYVFIVRIRISE